MVTTTATTDPSKGEENKNKNSKKKEKIQEMSACARVQADSVSPLENLSYAGGLASIFVALFAFVAVARGSLFFTTH